QSREDPGCSIMRMPLDKVTFSLGKGGLRKPGWRNPGGSPVKLPRSLAQADAHQYLIVYEYTEKNVLNLPQEWFLQKVFDRGTMLFGIHVANFSDPIDF